jgi:hypothetical protein
VLLLRQLGHSRQQLIELAKESYLGIQLGLGGHHGRKGRAQVGKGSQRVVQRSLLRGQGRGHSGSVHDLLKVRNLGNRPQRLGLLHFLQDVRHLK